MRVYRTSKSEGVLGKLGPFLWSWLHQSPVGRLWLGLKLGLGSGLS